MMHLVYSSEAHGIHVSAACDLLCQDEDGFLVLASFGGHDQAVRAVSAAIGGKCQGLYVPGGRRSLRLEEHYRLLYGKQGGVAHCIAVSGAALGLPGVETAPVVIAWDGDMERAFGHVLSREYGIPFAPEWVPYLCRMAQLHGLLVPCQTARAPGAPPVAAARLRMSDDALLEIVQSGLREGVLRLPEGPDAGPGGLADVNNVSAYLARFGPALGQRVADIFRPRHKAGTGAVSPAIGRLLRRPFPAQADVIEGLAAHLREERAAMVVGEMGCGKSLLGAVIPFVVEDGHPYRVLVMCPGHLVRKWKREVEQTIPGARAVILGRWEDVARLDPRAKPAGPEYYILSRDRAKLGYFLRPGAVWRDGKRAGWWCPDCGAMQTDAATGMPFGRYAFSEPRKSNARCGQCGTPLWAADNGRVRRYAPAEYIKRRLPAGYFGWLVADEVHELKGDSAQGQAFGALAARCGRVLALTGTLLGGYSSNLFRIAFRLNPGRLRAESLTHGSEMLWVSRYGVLERVVRERLDASLNVASKGMKSAPTVRERPGVNPVVFPRFLLGNTAFVELQDLAAGLPPYQEDVVLADMDPPLASAYKRLSSDLQSAVREALATGSKRLLATYLQTLLAYPDRPWGNPPIIDPQQGGVIAVPRELPQDEIYQKERLLVDIVRRARTAGRRCFVYAVYTGKKDVAGRLASLLETAGIRTAVLRAGHPAPADREAWIEARLREGVWAVVANPELVKTGLDLLAFPEIVFYETGYSIYTLRQAARRSWRIGQARPVRVTFLAYHETMQEAALRLMGQKLRASLALEGKFSEEGLLAMCESSDITLELAKALVEGMDGLESAEAAWRSMARAGGWQDAGVVAPDGGLAAACKEAEAAMAAAAVRIVAVASRRRGKALAGGPLQLGWDL